MHISEQAVGKNNEIEEALIVINGWLVLVEKVGGAGILLEKDGIGKSWT